MKENLFKLRTKEKDLEKKIEKPLLRKFVNYCRKKSPWILHMGCSSCNGCAIEILASLTPKYDLERFGILHKGSPRHADILIVEGIVNKKIKDRLLTIYQQMPEPKFVMAVGACAISGGIFYDSYNFAGPLDKIIPVDVYVPGCPPKPEALIHALTKVLKKMEEL
jgi:NADH-quinone oxidoreductase B subunit